MKIMYCWRCYMDVPMLDEEEFAIVETLYARAVRAIKEYCRTQQERSQEQFRNFSLEQYRPVLEAYRQMTGWKNAINPSDLMHHRISKYGSSCSRCGKPLRTPRAKHCAACGAYRSPQV